jgi:hypothetical protein
VAARVKAATAKYTHPRRALADGYVLDDPAAEGLEVHYKNGPHAGDGRVADPERPELLVYAVQGGRAVLLGVVFQMPRAGVPGPRFGGNSTRWHTHNVCLGALPPGFGVVSPFAGCPPLTVMFTVADMMHVWTVDPPGGPYVEHLDEKWVRDLVARKGVAA